MTIEEMLKAADVALGALGTVRLAYQEATKTNPIVAAQMQQEIQGGLQLLALESLAYSQLAKAKMDYEWFKEPEQST